MVRGAGTAGDRTVSGTGWGELGGPTTLTPRSRARYGWRRIPKGNAIFGALIIGADVIGLGFVAVMVTTTYADVITPTTGPALTVPDRAPAEEQSRDGAIATTVTRPTASICTDRRMHLLVFATHHTALAP